MSDGGPVRAEPGGEPDRPMADRGEPDGAAEVRRGLRRWIADHWDPDLPLSRWRALLADSGWACPA